MSFITYPLKVTTPLPIIKIFELFITSTYGGEQAWLPVKDIFSKVNQLRGEFSFEKHNVVTVANDSAACAKLIEQLTTYYKYLLFLQTKFKFEYFQQGAINIPFQWSNSFDKNKSISNPSLILEKSCILYNTAIIFYNEGSHLMNGTPDQRKISTQKFRFGLWAINQIKQLTLNMAPDIKATLNDFSEFNLDILYHTMLGNCYAVLFTNLVDQEDKIKVKNIASLASEASQNYTIALAKINALLQGGENIIPQDHMQKVKAYLFYNTVKFMTIAGMKMSKHHNDENEHDIKGNHIGWAISYINNSITTISKALQNEGALKIMEKDQINQLNKLKADCEKEFGGLNQRNTQIYNQQVPDSSKLPKTNLIDQLIIQPAEPKEIQATLVIDQASFSNFMSEEAMQMVQEIRQFAQQKYSEVDNTQKQIFDMKISAYLENYVNFFLDMASSKQQQQIPQKISDKISKYNQLGGSKQLQTYIQTLKESNVQCGLLLKNIKQKIEQEEQDDETMRKDYGSKWTSSTSSQSNKEYVNELKSLEDNFKVAYNIEMENQQRWSQNQNMVELMDKPHSEQVKFFVSGSSEEAFKQQNIELLNSMEQLDRQIQIDVNSIKDQAQNINNSIRNTNYNAEVNKALQNKVPQDKILEVVLEPISQQILALNDTVTHLSSKVSEICNIADELQHKRNQKGSSSNIQQSVVYSNGMTTLVELFDDCQQGMKFYQDLTCLVLDLDKKVSDFIQAREIEKANLIQMIHNESSKIRSGFNTVYVQQNAPFYPPPQQNNYQNPLQCGLFNPMAQYQQLPPPQQNPYQQNSYYPGQMNQGQSAFPPYK